MRVNVTGTCNVNLFAKSMRNLRHYHYVSTCYVAGKRRGRILETELKHAAGFRNYYEETKYLAETEVAALKADLPITIHRPSVVCGDSLTGETTKFDGVYFLIRYLLKAPRLFSILNIGNREVRLNLVPVDFVVEGLSALARDQRALGKTLQLADPNPLSTRELFDEISQEIVGHKSRLSLPSAIVEFALMSPPSPPLTGLPHSAVPYFFWSRPTTRNKLRSFSVRLASPVRPFTVMSTTSWLMRPGTALTLKPTEAGGEILLTSVPNLTAS